jgi:hypothetical protein
MEQENQTQQSAQTSESSTTNNSQTAAWAGEINDDFKELVANKGWKGVNDVLTSYSNMEKFAGKMSNAVVIPDPEDKEGWNKVFNKLGRPEAPNGYQFDVDLKNADDTVKMAVGKFSEIAFDAGLSAAQAKKVQSSWDAFAEEIQTQQEAEAKQNSERLISALKQEWGPAFENNQRLAQTAAQKYGFTADDITGIEGVVGFDKMMKMFASIGSGLVEDSYVSGGGAHTSTMTTAQAKRELQELQADPDYMDAHKNPSRHKALRAKAKDIYAALNPSQGS